MEIIETKLKGVLLIKLKPNFDGRGFFMRTYDEKIFKNYNINFHWVQENHSYSKKIGILRGLHFQLPPFTETKLIRCLKGKIFDVFVDLRMNSPTFGKWDSIELSENEFSLLLIPRGFAHGFITLTNDCEILYKVDNFYNPEYERGIIWNDPSLNIKWPELEPFLSEKDKNNYTLEALINKKELPLII